MDIDQITTALKQRLLDFTGLGYCIKFDFGDDGAIVVDGRASPPAIAEDDADVDTTIKLSVENGFKLLSGTLNPTLAYSMGKLKVDGSLGVALKVASMLDE